MKGQVVEGEDLAFKLEIAPGRAPTLESVARVLDSYNALLRAAAELVEPGTIPSIELVGVEPGSDVFLIALRKVEEFAEAFEQGRAEYPLVSKAAITLGSLIGAGVVNAVITQALTPDVRISKDQMAVFQESVELQRESVRLFKNLQYDPAYSRVKVLNGADRAIVHSISRSEFAERSELSQRVVPQKRAVETRRAIWDVVLIKPVLEAAPRRWQFARDGLKFSALMKDDLILDAIRDKTLPMQVAEGVTMRIEVEYKEQFDGATWRPMDHTRRVARVLSPRPPSRSIPLFETNNY